MTEHERDWVPVDSPDVPTFKWGFDPDTSTFTIWQVNDVGDGLPVHNDYLQVIWGRPTRPSDLLGYLLIEDTGLQFVVYYRRELPDKARTWAETTYPGKPIHVLRTGVDN